MSNDNKLKLPTMYEIAEYIDNEVPLQQLEDEPSFIDAQLAFTKSKHSKQAEQKKGVYKNRWFKGCK